MILSVSRRTDIPNHYAEWFVNRIKEGFLYVKNPVNPHQINKIALTPDVVDCIVFWTKNPEPMLEHLKELKDYVYYFQFTLTGYGKDIEPNLPDKRTELIPVFQKLSQEIGHERVVWRYDPIFINDRYTTEYHEKAFEEIACKLNGYTDKVVISFLDLYAKTKKNMSGFSIQEPSDHEFRCLAGSLAKIARNNGMVIETCAETLDLKAQGVQHGSCIDKNTIERITGCKLKIGKDRSQRAECGCIESIDIGTYDTCRNGCKYCYANDSQSQISCNIKNYDIHSPLLCGAVGLEDVITERKMKSVLDRQIYMQVFAN